MSSRVHARSLAAVGLPALLAAAGASAIASSPIRFDIPAGETTDALNAFSRAAGIELLFPFDAASGHRAPAVYGTYTREQALALLLAGTDLAVASDTGRTLTLRVKDDSSGSEAADASLVSEIVVTARRKEESIDSVPVSAQSFSQQNLQTRNVNTFGDLQHLVLSMSLSGTHRDEPRVSIRGQGGYSPGAAPGVSVYMNEVPLIGGTAGQDYTAGGGPGRYYDLERVEVLKGPQGTLFGRNSTGGAVLFSTRRASTARGGYLLATAGNYNDREVQGAFNLPVIGDALAVRVAGNVQSRDGFTHSLGEPGSPGGTDLDDRDSRAVRVSLAFTPLAAFRNDLILEHSRSDTNGTSAILSLVLPGNATRAYPSISDALARQSALGVRTQIPSGVDTYQRSKTFALQNLTKYDLSGDLTVRNIFGYTRYEASRAYAGSGSLEPVYFAPAQQGRPERARQLTNELQLQGDALRKQLSWTTGAFYLDSPPQVPNEVINLALGRPTQTETRAGERSKALYLAGTYDLGAWVRDLEMSAGLRYTWDHRFVQSRRTNPLTGACSATRGTDANCRLTGEADFSAPGWNVDLSYRLRPQSLVYATVRRGYRTGGFNLAALDPSWRAFGPEYVTSTELGAKSAWQLGTVTGRTAIAAYHDLYDDIQLTRAVLDEGLPTQVVSNSAQARIDGVELETSAAFPGGLELGVRASWYNFRYLSFSSAAQEAAIRSGFRRMNEPRVKYGLTARYDFGLPGSASRFDISADWSWQARSFITSSVDPLDTQPEYGLLSASANWRDVGGKPLDLSLFVTNATNEVYAVGGFPVSALVGTSAITYGEPRMYGVRVGFRFEE